jgi:hypothetical protein
MAKSADNVSAGRRTDFFLVTSRKCGVKTSMRFHGGYAVCSSSSACTASSGAASINWCIDFLTEVGPRRMALRFGAAHLEGPTQ